MQFDIITIFPEMFYNLTNYGIARKAKKKNYINYIHGIQKNLQKIKNTLLMIDRMEAGLE